ncbi:undecaprenyl-diphosphatase UppP [Isachenkonia alkalipeptolytica]|uniref:Undecaprenyl-diphosphatase n=1 Tax=Isachenkonia alkalipeptolytica TaxID=2565777 RepID=A0AA43XLL1_9CLOT|nr:undecaprenyl-diphosphatase UppP [Isachenkonia alkalipeptolytica]NBG88566.1 undecaprenyl-diphosphatase UppP [Isachenkonia alkalipeptolytica]
MSLLEAIILGIVQGITEFLPVSSSGHLALTQFVLGTPEDQIFFLTVMLHIGTIFSVLVVYWTDLYNMVLEFFKMCWDLLRGKSLGLDNIYRKLGVLIIVGSIPTALMGIFLKDIFSEVYTSQRVIGFALLITGTLLWTSERMQKFQSNKKALQKMTWLNAAIIGVFQGLAITPGMSRSGATISGALFQGINKEAATRYSFLLSFPVIVGASLLEARDAFTHGTGEVALPMLLLGIFTSFVAGVFAIRTLIRMISKGKLYYFSYYTWTLGTGAIILSFL